jgi:hypothetical protein
MLCLYPLHFLHIDHRHVLSSSVHLVRPKWRQWPLRGLMRWQKIK